MLLEFNVQNYLSIRDRQTLSFRANKNINHLDDYYTTTVLDERVLKIALIFGANASGKTNVLSALDFLRSLILHPKTSKTEHLDCTPFLLDDKTCTENSVFEILFIWNATKYKYSIEFNNNYVVKEILKKGHKKQLKELFIRTTDPIKQISKIKFVETVKIPETSVLSLTNNTLWNTTVISGFNKTNIECQELKDVYEWFSYYLNFIVRPNRDLKNLISKKIDSGEINKDKLLPILQRADFNIADISLKKEQEDVPERVVDFILSASPNLSDSAVKYLKSAKTISTIDVRFLHLDTNNKANDKIPYDMESLGTQRYYGLAGLLYLLIKKSNCYMIDELESSLHPDLFQHFLLSFCVNANQSQIIATTHNREILNNKRIFRNDMICIVDKDDNCGTILYKLSDFDTSVIRDTSNILNAYNSGRLGGIPNIGDYYINIDGDEIE